MTKHAVHNTHTAPAQCAHTVTSASLGAVTDADLKL
jgi:hypothetical protein